MRKKKDGEGDQPGGWFALAEFFGCHNQKCSRSAAPHEGNGRGCRDMGSSPGEGDEAHSIDSNHGVPLHA